MSRFTRALLAAGGLLVLAASPAAAAGNIVGPNQSFVGLVNGRHDHTTISVACPGPIRPGQTGHPFANQPLEVVETAAVPGGFTGSAANRIVASLGSTSGVAQTVTFKQYLVRQNIPTTFLLPCTGQGPVVFSPQPTSPTARADTVTVTFVSPEG